jgi:lysophospholipase L1-like esterase
LHFNSQGIRGPEYSFAKSADEYRIVILGDSFAEGYTVEFEELFSEVLKRNLVEQTGQLVEVINFGVAGYSTDQELLLYQQKVKWYHPDLTIIVFHENDVWYNNQAYYGAWGRGKKPLFRIDNGELILTNFPIPRRTGHHTIKTTLNDHSYLYRWAKNQIKGNSTLYSIAVALKIAELPYSSEEKRLIPKEFGIFQQTYSPAVREAWEITEALFAKLKEETKASGSDLLVFYVPMQAVVYDDRWEKMKQYYNLMEGEWSSERVSQELTNILERLEIKFLNPLEQMREHKNNPAHSEDRLYFLHDGHWNIEGNRFTGEIIAEYVMAHFSGLKGI